MTDAGQFEAFVRQYQRMVFATAVRLLGNAADAEDAAQTVFLRAFERFEMIGPSPTAAGWLRKVTTNVCLDHLSRYRRRWRFFSEMGRGDPAEGEYEEGLASPEPAPATGPAAERQAGLEQALQCLPSGQRVPLVLFHFEGHSYQEIAETLGVTLGKVKTDIYRGRLALRKRLTEETER